MKAALLSPVEKISDSNNEEGELLSSGDYSPKQVKKYNAASSGGKAPPTSHLYHGQPQQQQQPSQPNVVDYPSQAPMNASRKKPSRWNRPIATATADPIQRSYSNYQDYRSRPIYHRDRREIVSLNTSPQSCFSY